MPTKPQIQASLNQANRELTNLRARIATLQAEGQNQSRATSQELEPPLEPPRSSNTTINRSAQIIRLTQPKEFAYEADSQSNHADRWKTWIRRFNSWLVSSGLDTETDARKISILTTTAGEAVEDLCETHAPGSTSYTTVTNALNNFFSPIQDAYFATLQFRQMSQRQTEPVDEFVQRLRIAARNCAFDQEDKEIYLQLMSTATSTEVKKRSSHWRKPHNAANPSPAHILCPTRRGSQQPAPTARQAKPVPTTRNKPHPLQQGTAKLSAGKQKRVRSETIATNQLIQVPLLRPRSHGQTMSSKR